MKSLLIVASYHHGNTETLARVIAEVLGARVKYPHEVDPGELGGYELVGFGSGIYDARHHESLMRLAEGLSPADGRKAFIFSTNGMPIAIAGKAMVAGNSLSSHAMLRERLESRGYRVVAEFGCAGFNTNSFLRLFGGINKGRPKAEDLADAREFARGLLRGGALTDGKGGWPEGSPGIRP